MTTTAQTKLRPLASIPNKVGFVLIGVRRDGSEAELVVYLDRNGFHTVQGYAQLSHWRMK